MEFASGALMTSLQNAFTLAVASLRFGEVVSYADVAKRAGRPKASRAAGRFLATSGLDIPWWRVVYSDGRLAEVNRAVQANRLEDEGVQLNATRAKVLVAPLGRFRR